MGCFAGIGFVLYKIGLSLSSATQSVRGWLTWSGVRTRRAEWMSKHYSVLNNEPTVFRLKGMKRMETSRCQVQVGKLISG